jgi:hypothetical protein
MATPITAESTRLEMFKWLATETDNDLIVEVAAFVKKHTFKKREEDFFKPMTEQELTEKIIKARNSTKSYTTSEAREMVKNGNR